MGSALGRSGLRRCRVGLITRGDERASGLAARSRLIEVIAVSEAAVRSTAQGAGTGIDPDLMKKVDAVIEQYRGNRGALIPVLHEVQEIIGYLPRFVQSKIAEALGVSEAEVYGVVTFYSLFTMKPAGRHKIGVCLGTACYVKGAAALLEAVKQAAGVENDDVSADGRFSVEVTRCIGACGLAPVLTIDEDVYSRVSPESVSEILEKYE